MHSILLYYKYTPIPDPGALKIQQKELCKKLGLKGRILISDQGINGTIGGQADNIEQYKQATQAIPELADMEWKESEGPEDTFPRLRVVVRKEIVTLGLKAQESDVELENKAAYIEPDELLDLYESGDEFCIVDARNEYESRIGKFKNALTPDIDAFREIPEFVEEHMQQYRDKPVVTYCTGGVRCEKFSAYLRERGFSDVRQLHGGVHVYAEKTGGKHFEGELYVFDGRISMPVNEVNPSVISRCHQCGVAITRYVNCAHPPCNKRLVCCEACEEHTLRSCSSDCKKLIQQPIAQ